nr:hypothetical protein [Tanacetum cinerariifolium]
MEEYIELEAEKARRRVQTFKWQIATYVKFWYHEDIDYFKEFETYFLAIVFNDAVTTDHKISSEPMRPRKEKKKIYNSNKESTIHFSALEREGRVTHEIQFMDLIFSAFLLPDTCGNFNKDMAPPPPRAQRHQWLRYEVEGYTNEIILDFEERLGMIFGRQIATKADLRGYWSRIASDGDLLEMVSSYTSIRDPLRRLCHRLIMRRKREAKMSGRHFIGRLVEHFGLVTEEGLQGLTMVVGELRVIEIDELVVTAEAAQADQEIPKEGVQADPTPVQALQAPTAAPATRTMPQRMARLEEEVRRVRKSSGEQLAVFDAMSRDFSRFTTWTVGRLSQLLDASEMTYTS